MSRQVATAYTGANISIVIGENTITNAFGVSYEVSQNKRPIYGYNSMHYDAVASGQVIVLGQLYLTFQHPNYLSTILKEYFESKDIVPDKYTNYGGITFGPDGIREYPFTGYRRTGSGARQDRSYSSVLDSLFDNSSFDANYLNMQSGGAYAGERELVGNSGTNMIVEGFNIYKVDTSPIYERNLPDEYKYVPRFSDGKPIDPKDNKSLENQKNSMYARPDQFTNNGAYNKKTGIDIVIGYGDPGLNGEDTGILSYMPSSSIILEGVHFIGESQQIMADDQPIMETYKFLARSKKTLLK